MSHFNLGEVREQELYPGYFGKVIQSDSMTLVYWRAEAGAPLPAHAHPQEQVVSVYEGQLALSFTGGETSILGPGEVAVIPGNVEHSGRAVTDCEFPGRLLSGPQRLCEGQLTVCTACSWNCNASRLQVGPSAGGTTFEFDEVAEAGRSVGA